MPYKLIWEHRGVIKHFSGFVTGPEIFQAGMDAEGDSRFDDYRYAINDFLDCTGSSISPDLVDEVAAVDLVAARVNRKIRIAVVATAPEIIVAATQYANSPMNVYPTRIFSNRKDARAWLDADNE